MSNDHEQSTPQQEATQQQGPSEGTQTPDTLFGAEQMEEIKSEEQKKKDAEQQRRKEAQKNAGGAEKTFPAGTEFRYSGHTKVLPEEMSESKVFEWVADDFPEIEKARFTLRYDQAKGRVVPVPQAQKKGVCAAGEMLEVRREPPEGSPPPVYRLLCADGVYEVRSNLSGAYVVRLDSRITLAEGYYPSVPKAPATLLEQIVSIFKERPDTEALIDLVYNRREDYFCLLWNQKEAGASSVEYQPLPDHEDLVLYAEVHSHHRMSAFVCHIT